MRETKLFAKKKKKKKLKMVKLNRQDTDSAVSPVGHLRHGRPLSARSHNKSNLAKTNVPTKGIRKIFTHDLLQEKTSVHPARIHSMDSLNRVRNLSMISLNRARSNPGLVASMSHSHHVSNHQNAFGLGSPGLKPRRSKSTHSVLQYGEDEDHIGNNFIDFKGEEEEVDHFTDDDIENDHDKIEDKQNKPQSEDDSHQDVEHIHKTEFTIGTHDKITTAQNSSSDVENNYLNSNKHSSRDKETKPNEMKVDIGFENASYKHDTMDTAHSPQRERSIMSESMKGSVAHEINIDDTGALNQSSNDLPLEVQPSEDITSILKTDNVNYENAIDSVILNDNKTIDANQLDGDEDKIDTAKGEGIIHSTIDKANKGSSQTSNVEESTSNNSKTSDKIEQPNSDDKIEPLNNYEKIEPLNVQDNIQLSTSNDKHIPFTDGNLNSGKLSTDDIITSNIDEVLAVKNDSDATPPSKAKNINFIDRTNNKLPSPDEITLDKSISSVESLSDDHIDNTRFEDKINRMHSNDEDIINNNITPNEDILANSSMTEESTDHIKDTTHIETLKSNNLISDEDTIDNNIDSLAEKSSVLSLDKINNGSENNIRKNSDDHIGNDNLSKIVSETDLEEDSNELTRQTRNAKSRRNENEFYDEIANDSVMQITISNNSIDQNNNSTNGVDNKPNDNHEHYTDSGTKNNVNNVSNIYENDNDIIPNKPHFTSNGINDQYIPNMILSQSTGMERTFENPPSIQNSLIKDNNNGNKANNNDNNDNVSNNDNNNLNNDNNNIDESEKNKQNRSHNSIQRDFIPDFDKIDEDKQNSSTNCNNQDTINNNNYDNINRIPANSIDEVQKRKSSFSNSFSSLTNNLQRADAAAAANANNKLLNNNVNSNVRPNLAEISNGHKGSSNSIKRNFASQQSPLRNETQESKHTINAPSLLSQLSTPKANNVNNYNNQYNGKSTGNASKIDNFSQFLKTEGMDGDSRTQRKLWLQRENSILDLNLQSDNVDAIFMATNVNVKRQFERITQEYTNVRRFCNPVDSALSRFEKNQKGLITNSTSNKTTIKHGNPTREMDGLAQSLVAQNNSYYDMYGTSDNRNVNDKLSNNNVEEMLDTNQNAKLQRIINNIWKQESLNFNDEVNPLNRNANASTNNGVGESNSANMRPSYFNSTSSHQAALTAARHSLRNAMESGINLHHQQRTINSLQPSTRAVNRRMESSHQRA